MSAADTAVPSADPLLFSTNELSQNAGLQDHLSPIVEARLTDVVRRLRCAWIAGPALLWHDICAIRELVGSDLDKRVAATVEDGFFEFSQFLAGLEVFVLKLEQLRVVGEQPLLSLEQLRVEVHNGPRKLIEISNAQRGLSELLGSSDRSGDGADLGVVHG